MRHCDYCGTGLLDDEPDVCEATGTRHYTEVCREYVFQVKQHAGKEARELRAQLAAAKELARAVEDGGKPAKALRLFRALVPKEEG